VNEHLPPSLPAAPHLAAARSTPADLPYRLVALDLDGTVMAKGRPIAPRVLAAVAEACRRGARVALATGRMYRSTAPFAAALGTNAPIICYQGAWVRDPASGATLYQRGIPVDLAHETVRLARDLGLIVNVYLDDEIHIEAITPTWQRYYDQATGASPPRVVGDMLGFLTREPTHLAMVTDADRTRALVEQVRAHFGGRLYVTTGHPLFCELSHPEVSKGRAVRFLAERLGVPREQVLAVGDNLNDLDMVEWAGLGVAMANSPPELLAAADAVVPTVHEDGVAEAIERFVLGE